VKCLVLGGGGFIGSHVVDRLLFGGHRVRILERPRVPRYRDFTDSESIEWLEGDFQSAKVVRDAVDGIDALVHLVSTTLPKSSNDDPVFDVESNLVGTLRMMQFARVAGVRKIVFISSGGTVYGDPIVIPIPETHPTEPKVSYGIVKLAIEKYLAVFHALYRTEYVVLRVANPYGDRQRTETSQGAVAAFVERAISGTPIEIWGDGGITRDYVYIADVADAFLRALDYSGSERIFNIGSGRGHRLDEVVSTLERLLCRTLPVRHLPSRAFDVPSNVLDVSRAGAVLGWRPTTAFEDGLRATLAWAQRKREEPT